MLVIRTHKHSLMIIIILLTTTSFTRMILIVKMQKSKKYGSEYDISKSSDYNCEYNASGQLRCWKYKIREAQDKKFWY